MKPTSRMFNCVTETWNPVVGCQHDCSYCWARRLAETKLRHTKKYEGFKPRIWEKEFKRKFKPEALVFVSDMGDLFGCWVDQTWIWQVLSHIRKFPQTTFLLLTKNPERYFEFNIPQNCILGTTIESNRHYPDISKAPSPKERYHVFHMLNSHRMFNGEKIYRLMISIEPIMQFDLPILTKWIKNVEPEFVYVGYDNYGHGLIEPSLEKTNLLIQFLKGFTNVIPKR